MQQLIANGPENNDWQHDLSFIDDKIAEILQLQKEFLNAIAQFETALAIAQKLAEKDPANLEWRRDVASKLTKIGDALAKKPQPDLDGAVARFDAALGFLNDLAVQQPDNNVVLSNLAHAHNRKAQLLSNQADHNEAITEFHFDIAIQKQLVDKDPGNVFWLSVLAADFRAFGNFLKSVGDLDGALAQYSNELQIREKLVNKDPNNGEWKSRLQDCKTRIENLHAPAVGGSR